MEGTGEDIGSSASESSDHPDHEPAASKDSILEAKSVQLSDDTSKDKQTVPGKQKKFLNQSMYMFVYCICGLACVNVWSLKITSLPLKLPFKNIIERLSLGLNQETVQFVGRVDRESQYLHMYELQLNMQMLNLLSPSSTVTQIFQTDLLAFS